MNRNSFIVSLVILSQFLTSARLKAEPLATLPSTTYFKVTDMSNGLPDNSINDITEDPYGFIWIATWNGLARFDGKYIKTYSNQPDDEFSLSVNMVRAVCADNDGVWVGTDVGLDFFRFCDNKFIHAKRYFADDSKKETVIDKRVSHIMKNGKNLIAQTIDGDILILDNNKTAHNFDNIVFRTIKRPNSRKYADITAYKDGKLMALSNEGITILDSDCNRELYHNNIPHKFDANLNIFCDTVNNKVYTGSGIGNEAHIFEITGIRGELSPSSNKFIPKGLMGTAKGNGVIYLATDGGGLHALTHDGQHIQYIPSNSSLPCDAIYTVFSDSKHNIWCGTYRHGLCMMSRELNSYAVFNMSSGSLSYNIVTSIIPNDDYIFVGLDGGGIDFFNRMTGKYVNINSENTKLPGNNVVSMVNDGNTLYAAIYSCGLSEISLTGGGISTYSPGTDAEEGNKLWTIADDCQGNIWVGGSSLHIFNKDSKSFNLVEGTKNMGISSIIEDGVYMWVATFYSGVLKINKNTKEIEQRFSNSPTSGTAYLPGEHAVYMFIDSRHLMWVNVDNKILCSLDIDNGNSFVTHDSKQGLSNAHVSSMIEDGKGDLWIGTDDGLFKYVRERNAFIRKQDSRVPLTYTQGATAQSGNYAYMGTTGGMLSFSLSGLSPRDRTAPAMFTSINILDANDTEIPLFAQENPKVTLSHSQNFFTVKFTVPEMSNPEQIQFECKLEGLENVWRDASDTRSASYTNVPSGEYKLLLRHTNPDGSWTNPKEMTINVNPAWYASIPMILIWILLAIIVSARLIKLRQKFIENKNKTIMAEMERDAEKKLNEAKLDFYASISHELRTPCFLISAQIEEIFDSERQAVPVSSLSGIYRNSAKLNKLITHIIDFRKNDAGQLKLVSRKIEIVDFLKNLTIDYEHLCRQKALSFSYTHDNHPIELIVDPDKLEQIITNLISNAYKYTPKGGKVTLSVHEIGNDKVAISVSDTGIGIADKVKDTVFKPFFRSERGQAQSAGDGIGLSFVKELVELHNGTITLDSQINEGSTFTVIIPKAQPNQSAPGQSEEIETPVSESCTQSVVTDQKSKSKIVNTVSNPTATHAILIVDDDPDVIELVSRAFEGEYKVGYAEDGKKGVELANTGDYDVVITDIMMPVADGHHLIKELKSNRRTAHIKIVVFSALASEEDMLKALDEGADTYLLKPTSLKVLRRQIDRLFEHNDNPAIISSQSDSGQYTREDQKFLLECRHIIDDNIEDENFGIEMLASKLAMSHSTLYKRIRRITGMSLIDFISDYKICKAVAMIRNGNTNVQSVADACGFRDVKTFRETFKRKMNMPPKQFILQLNNPTGQDS